MRLTCLLLMLIPVLCMAQDSDIPTYHTKRESFSKVTDPALRNDLASFTLGGLDEGIGKNPLKAIAASDYGDYHVSFAGEGVQVKITAGKFDRTKHKLLLYDEDKYVIKIDNKPFWGVDGQLPKKEIQSVTVMFNRDTVQLPAVAFNDLYEPRFCTSPTTYTAAKCNSAVYLSADKRTIYIYMLNSDGKNGYEITWIVQDKKYLRRVIDYGF